MVFWTLIPVHYFPGLCILNQGKRTDILQKEPGPIWENLEEDLDKIRRNDMTCFKKEDKFAQ